jgi:hypothetical protein
LSGAKVQTRLNLEQADIGASLLMGHGAEFQRTNLRSAKVGGQLSLSGTKINGPLTGEVARIAGDMFLRECVICGGANFVGAVFAGDVFLGGAKIGRIDLHGARIAGELNLAPPTPTWEEQAGVKSRLNLQNASCDVIQDSDQEGVWPAEIELDGFTYRRFGGLGSDAQHSIVHRDPQWFVDWLAKDAPYTPQPYQQCANVLRDMGHPEMATHVLYQGRERERREALKTGNNPRATRLFLLKCLIGYGYGHLLFWRPLLWGIALTTLGALLPEIADLWPALAGESSRWCTDVEAGSPIVCLHQQSFGWRFLFSLDMLLPIVELSREHSVLQAGLDGLAYGWFVIQGLLGWVLALFLIAGLSGLTK